MAFNKEAKRILIEKTNNKWMKSDRLANTFWPREQLYIFQNKKKSCLRLIKERNNTTKILETVKSFKKRYLLFLRAKMGYNFLKSEPMMIISVKYCLDARKNCFPTI